jgi:hypothetical protein
MTDLRDVSQTSRRLSSGAYYRRSANNPKGMSRAGRLDMLLVLQTTPSTSSGRSGRGIEMRFRVPVRAKVIRDLARLGLFVGPGDQPKLPGKDRRPSGDVRLCCPKCAWTSKVPRAMPLRHRPKCPIHKISKGC